MISMELLMLCPIGLALLLLVGNGLLCLIQDAVYQDGGHQRRYDAFMRDTRRRGLSCAQARDELRLREELARLRREASDGVQANPSDWHMVLTSSKKEAIERLAETRPDLAQRLAQALTEISYGHILYPEECRLVDRLSPADLNLRPNADQIAALRIVRAG